MKYIPRKTKPIEPMIKKITTDAKINAIKT